VKSAFIKHPFVKLHVVYLFAVYNRLIASTLDVNRMFPNPIVKDPKKVFRGIESACGIITRKEKNSHYKYCFLSF